MAPDIQSSVLPGPVALDDRPVRHRVGLVLLSTDHTTERDFARLTDPAKVGIYANRITFQNPADEENLRKTGPRLTEAAAQILPGEAVDVIAYACTAASVVLGNEAVAAQLGAAKPGTPCVTPSSAAFDAFTALGTRRISILTPYTVAVTDVLARYFAAHDLDIVSASCLGLGDDREMARVSEDSIIAAAVAATDPRAEALFVSCTALRAAQCAGRIEDRIGKPVITSNQATVWRTLRHLGLSAGVAGAGRIFDL